MDRPGLNESVLGGDHTCRRHGCYDVIVPADVDSGDGCLTAQPFSCKLSDLYNRKLPIDHPAVYFPPTRVEKCEAKVEISLVFIM